MESLFKKWSAERRARSANRIGQVLTALRALRFALCALLAGCAGTGSFLQWGEEKPYAEPCWVVAAWNPAVVYTPDPMHDGTPTPGLAGRIYLFGPEIGFPMLGNGGLSVALFDDGPGGTAKSTTPLEEWHFDPTTLKRLEHRDPVGWGYTVFLPWGSYKPEITHIHLKVRYEPPQGFPIYAASAPMTLVDPEKVDKVEVSEARLIQKGDQLQKIEPAAASAPATPAAATALAPPAASGRR
jgi:hypothetical protein